MKTLRILILLAFAAAIVLAACDKDSSTEPSFLDSELMKSLDGDSTPPDQGGPGEGEPPPVFLLEGPGAYFFWALDLTEEQQQQIREIGQKYQKANQPPGQGGRPGNPPSEGEKVRRDSLRQVMHDEMVGILTDAQKAVLEQIEAQLQNGEYPDIAVEKKVAFLTEKLALTADQQAQFGDFLKTYGDQLIAARSPDQDPREGHEAVRGIFEELDERVRLLLNDEQLEAYEALRAECRPEQGLGGSGGQGRGGRRPGGPKGS